MTPVLIHLSRYVRTWAVCCLLTFTWTTLCAADWPTYRGDSRRSGVSGGSVSLPLAEAWVHQAAKSPSPAWSEPAKHDYWHRKYNLNPRVIYDRAHHVVSADGSMFYGTSADDSVVCLDARTGAVRWTFSTQGPVRLAPTCYAGRVYAGSDDGCVYCLSAAEGDLLWKTRPGPKDELCIGNGRLISRWPIRSGVLAVDGIVYCAAGLFPTSEGAYLAALDATTGAEIYRRKVDQSTQGYMLLAGQRLLLPSGRTAPGVFDRSDGRHLGSIGSAGGGFALVADDALAAGSGDGSGVLSLSDPKTLAGFVSFDGLHLIAGDDRFFVHSRDALTALDRPKYVALARQHADQKMQLEKLGTPRTDQAKAQAAELKRAIGELAREMAACRLWRTPSRDPFSIILAGETLFTGGDGAVTAYNTGDGRQEWSATVTGRAYGLAIADGRLVVSTSTGAIYCFQPAPPVGAEDQPVSADEELAVTAAPPVEPQVPAQADRAPVDYRRAAESILTATGADQGFCLVLDAGAGHLAAEIAERSRLRVVCLESDEQLAESARRMLREEGLYGQRVVVHHGSAADLRSYPPYFANLIVSSGALAGGPLPPSQVDLLRVLRPSGGAIALTLPRENDADVDAWLAAFSGDQVDVQRIPHAETSSGRASSSGGAVDLRAVLRRRTLAGAGQWTHSLADPGNTACTMDQLVAGPMAVQWFGAPGPRPMADRHHRNVTPLYNDGRLFAPGENLVIAVDAYNGTPLWRREVANSLRLGAFLDGSNMVVDECRLYVVADDACRTMDVASGDPGPTLTMPQLLPEDQRHWGYVARAGGLLIGSACKPQAAYRAQSRAADIALWYDNMALVTSDYLFALAPDDGKEVWTYRSGTILNTTITIGGDRVYFVASHSQKSAANPLGRMPMKTLLEGSNELVALDLTSGQTLWKRDIDLSECRMIAYLNYAQEKLVLSGNRNVDSQLWYSFYGLDAKTGEAVWQQTHSSGYKTGGDHGEQNRHPTIVGDTVYTYPLAYKLHTGAPVDAWQFSRNGHGCGNISASASSIFWRGGNPWQRDLGPSGTASRINSVTRPGCWINIIPAGGLLMIPEASSGCTCAFPLQTSITYVPRSTVVSDGQ